MRSRKESGYSLVELVLVVSILALLAALALPAPPAHDTAKLDVAAAEFAAAARFARSEAQRTGEPHGFQQQTAPARVRVFRLDTSVSPPNPVYDVRHPVTKQLFDVDLAQLGLANADSLSVTAEFRAACSQTDLVAFDARGNAWCTNPETVLLDYFELDIVLGTSSRRVRTDGMTGRVTVQ